MADRSVLVRLRADVSDFVAKSQLARAAVRSMNDEIDKSNDRTAWLAQGILALTPAVTRLGAGAVPVLSGIATQLTVGAAAAGVAALAFNGVGDALTALNEYQLDPTEANLDKLNETMAKIGPNGQQLVEFLDSLGPAFSAMANSARGGVFPGVIDGIQEFMTLAPQLNDIVREIGEGLGQLATDAGEGLAGPRFEAFFEYLETRAKPILIEMGRTLGNFTTGLLNMLVAFDPLTDDFSKGLLDMSRSFEQWSAGLESSTGFQEFLDYVREAGPAALDFLGAFINAMVEIAEAAAPVGAVMLPILTGMLNVLGDLANTPLGPITLGFLSLTAAWGRLNAVMAITGSGVMSKATAGLRGNLETTRMLIPSFRELGTAMAFSAHSQQTLMTSMQSGSKIASESARNALLAKTQVQAFGKAAAPIAGQVGLMAVAMSDFDDKLGLTNTTSLALAGSLMGGMGAALGATAGFMLDSRAAADALSSQLRALDDAAAGTDLSVLDAQLSNTAEMLRKAKADAEDLKTTTGVEDFFGDAATAGLSWDAQDAQAEKVRLLQEAYDDATEARQRLTEAEAKAATEAIRAQDADRERDSIVNAIEAETAALEANVQAMREKRAEALRGLNAELDYKASLLDAADALKENGRTVNENTRAGQDNLRALYGMAAAFNAQSDSAKDSAREVRAGRESFIEMATAMGMGETAARRLAKQLYELPAKVPIEIGVDHETAMAHARAVKAELASIDRNVDIYINVRRPNNAGFGAQIDQADGGVIDFYANGGMRENHVAQIAPAGAWRVWAEPETGGEAYIPLAASKRERSIDIWEEVGARLGVTFERYANGGTRDGKRTRRDFEAGTSPGTAAALEAAIARLTEVSERQTEALEDSTARTDWWTERTEFWSSKMDDVAKATIAGFSTGLFDRDSNIWAAGAGGGPIANLTGDISGLLRREELQRQLEGMGVSGNALATLLGEATGPQGNDQLASLIASGQIPMIAGLIDQRAGLQASVGGQAGQAAFGAEFAAAEAGRQASLAEQKIASAKLDDTVRTLNDINGRMTQIESHLRDAPERTGARVAAEFDGNAADGWREGRNGGRR